jgi:hypothetical protein
MLALYSTIWIGLALFALGETGRSFPDRGGRPRRWAWWIFVIGLVFTIVHTLLAFDVVHNWVHADAVRSTAMQTDAVFGMAVGWGVYVNYAFLVVWLADAWWWRVAPAGYVRPGAVTWALRAFYMIMIFNGAVVFAAGARRLLGLAIVGWLCVAWAFGRPATPALSARRR